jgi:hypothetical protein
MAVCASICAQEEEDLFRACALVSRPAGLPWLVGQVGLGKKKEEGLGGLGWSGAGKAGPFGLAALFFFFS